MVPSEFWRELEVKEVYSNFSVSSDWYYWVLGIVLFIKKSPLCKMFSKLGNNQSVKWCIKLNTIRFQLRISQMMISEDEIPYSIFALLHYMYICAIPKLILLKSTIIDSMRLTIDSIQLTRSTLSLKFCIYCKK